MNQFKNSTLLYLLSTMLLTLTNTPPADCQTVTPLRPRIWITPDDITKEGRLPQKCAPSGSHYNEFSQILAWCDQHINDDPSMISQNSDYNWPGQDNYALHLLNYSLAAIVTSDAKYGRRAVTLLAYLSKYGAPPDFDPAVQGSDGETLSLPAIAIAYDWCHSYILNSPSNEEIRNYLLAIVRSATSRCNSTAVTYKTEEPWYAAFPAIAIYGEDFDDGSAHSITSDFLQWFPAYLKNYEETGFCGGIPFGGTYAYIQLPHHLASFMELLRTSARINYWTAINPGYTPPPPYDQPGSDFARNFFRQLVLESRPGLLGLKIGDDPLSSLCYDGPMFIEYSWPFASIYRDPLIQAWSYLVTTLNPTYNTTSTYRNRLPHLFFKILWEDKTIQPSIANNPKGNFWPGVQKVTFRSGFDFSTKSLDIGGRFILSTKHPYAHWHADQGHISLWRGLDALLIDSGYYDYWDSEHYNNYFTTPAAHNVIVINREGFRFSNSNTGTTGYDRNFGPRDEQNDFGSITHYSHIDDLYTYARGDLTPAYIPGRVQAVTRDFVFLRNRYLIVFDQIVTEDPSYSALLLWHPSAEPYLVSGTGWTSAPGTNHVSHDARAVTWTAGRSKAFYRLVYPEEGVVFRKVGGQGYNYCDLNYVPRGTKAGFESGEWRFEVASTSPGPRHSFLSLIQAGDSSDPESPCDFLTSPDANPSPFAGVFIRDTSSTPIAALFATEAATSSDRFSIRLQTESASFAILFAGLPPGFYAVKKDGIPMTSTPLSADAGAGVLYFTVSACSAECHLEIEREPGDMPPRVGKPGRPELVR